MSEKVASALKLFTQQSLRLQSSELRAVLSMELETQGVLPSRSGQTSDLKAPTAHHCPLETAMLQKAEPLSKQDRHSGHCDPSLVHCLSAKCSKNLNEKKLVE